MPELRNSQYAWGQGCHIGGPGHAVADMNLMEFSKDKCEVLWDGHLGWTQLGWTNPLNC